MAVIRTYADVRAEIARAGVRHQDVARQMKMTPTEFSGVLADREGRPSVAWIARFSDALEALTGAATE